MSSDYVSFLLDLAGEGDNRAVRETVRYRRDPAVRPKTAFEWKITCDVTSKVIVVGYVRSKARVIASARWHAGALAEHQHLDRATPTSFQWNLIETALRAELARRAGMHDRSGEPPITRDELVEDDSLDAELDAAPAEALAPKAPVFVRDRKRDARSELLVAEQERVRKRRRVIAISCGALVLAGGIVPIIYTATRDRPASSPATTGPTISPIDRAPPPPPPPPPPREEPIEVRIAKAANVRDALALARPAMTDTTEELGAGARLFATYAAEKLSWADVDVEPETTVGHVLKDPDVERGKRMCADGTIGSIERRDLGARKIYVGTLRLPDEDSIAFVAVGTTGDLVKRNPARFCGAVIGRSGAAVSMVGMFDLPENRSPIVEQ